jgi:hypothetical protein
VELHGAPPFGNGAPRTVAVSDNAYQIDAHPSRAATSSTRRQIETSGSRSDDEVEVLEPPQAIEVVRVLL